MTTFNPQFISDTPLQNVNAVLRDIPGGFEGDVDIVFDGGRKTVTKTVDLADLTQEERDAGLLFYNALHAAGLASIEDRDFKR